jgi:CIC family chloride channel protein
LFFSFSPLIVLQDPEKFSLGINTIIILPLLIVFGIVIGLFSLIFISFLRSFLYKVEKLFEKHNKIWVLPFIGALAYSIFLFIVIPLIPGGYDNAVIHPDDSFLNFLMADVDSGTLDWILFSILLILFLIAIFLSIGMQNSAGIIMPLLLLGALFGSVFGMIFYPQNPGLFTLLGISAFLGAALNNPITAIVIIIEMTWAPYLFFPVGITTIIAYIFSGPNSIIPHQKYVRAEIS